MNSEAQKCIHSPNRSSSAEPQDADGAADDEQADDGSDREIGEPRPRPGDERARDDHPRFASTSFVEKIQLALMCAPP